MIITFTQKNKFGGYSHEIKLNPLFFIRVTETSNRNFLIELVERGMFSKKVHFSKPVEGNYKDLINETVIIFLDENLLFNLSLNSFQAQEWITNFYSFIESKKENLKKLTILDWEEN